VTRDVAAYERQLAARRKRFIETVARTTGCIDCGTSEGRLEFDHREPDTKNFNIGQTRTYSLRRLITEMELCDVRCSRCHRRRHTWRPSCLTES